MSECFAFRAILDHFLAPHVAHTYQASPPPFGLDECAQWRLYWLSVLDVVDDHFLGWGWTVYDIYVSVLKENGMVLYRTVRCRWGHSLPSHVGFESRQLSRKPSRNSSTSVITRRIKKPTETHANTRWNKDAPYQVALKFEQDRIESSVFIFVLKNGQKRNLQFKFRQMSTCDEISW